MKTLIISTIIVLSAAACLNSNAAPHLDGAETHETIRPVSITDFQFLTGAGWTGTLTYLDYTKETRESIPVEVSIDPPKKRSIAYAMKFPGEAKYNTREKIKLSRRGDRLNGDRIINHMQLSEGGLKIVTEKQSKDDNRPATIRTSYIFRAGAFKIRKDVKFSDESNYFNRNEFSLTR